MSCCHTFHKVRMLTTPTTDFYAQTRHTFIGWYSWLVAAVSVLGACGTEPAHVAGSANGITIHHAFAPQAVLVGDTVNATMAVYFSIDNAGDADTLDAIATPVASSAMMHSTMQHDGMVSMMSDSIVEIGARRSLRLAPGARHVMLDGLHLFPLAGDSLPLTMHFRHAGTITISVPVIDYASLDSAARAAR